MDTDPSVPLSLIPLVGAEKVGLVLNALLWIAVIFLLVSTAFISTALSSLLRLDLGQIAPFQETGESANVNRLRKLLRKPSKVILSLGGGALFLFSLGVTVMFLTLARNVLALLPNYTNWVIVLLVLCFLAAVFAFLFFGWLLPTLLLAKTEFLLKNATVIYLFHRASLPLVFIPSLLANLFADLSKLPEALGLKDLEVYQATAEEEEELEHKEREMISAIVEMGETVVREIMTPRVDIVAIDADEPLKKVLKRVADSPFSRYPVYEGTVDNIIGILHIRHLMKTMVEKGEDFHIRDILAPATFVPESKRIDGLLQSLQREKTHIAIVTDEYGGFAGLVTIEDILEEIVGEIHDEYDVAGIEPVQYHTDGSFVVNAMLPLDEFTEKTGLRVEHGEHDTIGGLLYAKFGRIPKKGDEVYIDGVKFTMLLVERNRIKLVQVRKIEE